MPDPKPYVLRVGLRRRDTMLGKPCGVEIIGGVWAGNAASLTGMTEQLRT